MSDPSRDHQEFRPVTGYDGKYEVDSLGNIYSNARGSVRKLLKPQIYTNHGASYAYVNLYRKGKMTGSSVHRIVAKAFLGYDDKSLEVNHKDKDTLNNNLSNLEWCSRQENAQHGLSKTYRITHPSGDIITIFNLEKYCRDNNLDSSNMKKVISGKRKIHRGYIIAS